jgi:hypothetical protein
MTVTSKDHLPFIGWKACEGSFYLDGLLISTDEAVTHWRRRTARFLPNAAKMVRAVITGMTRDASG